ncbi:hypothetical protein FJZ36_18025 [Candidatus Poribacteria bacterium]|nr:hypothetical protein [Candidatus Poribacteria bacterium]
MRLCRELGDLSALAKCLEGFGELAMKQSRYLRASRLLAVARATRTKLHVPLPKSIQQRFDTYETALRHAVGDDALAGATSGDVAFTPDEAIEYALGDSDA